MTRRGRPPEPGKLAYDGQIAAMVEAERLNGKSLNLSRALVARYFGVSLDKVRAAYRLHKDKPRLAVLAMIHEVELHVDPHKHDTRASTMRATAAGLRSRVDGIRKSRGR